MAARGEAAKKRWLERADLDPVDAVYWAAKPLNTIALGQYAAEFLDVAVNDVTRYGETGLALQHIYAALLRHRMALLGDLMITAGAPNGNTTTMLADNARQYGRKWFLDRTCHTARDGQVYVDSVALYDGSLDD